MRNLTPIDRAWADDAACKGMAKDYGYDLFFDETMENQAKQICAQCPVRAECLFEAISNSEYVGVYGGMNPREREGHYRRYRYLTRTKGMERTVESLLAWNEQAAG